MPKKGAEIDEVGRKDYLIQSNVGGRKHYMDQGKMVKKNLGESGAGEETGQSL